MEGRTLHVLRWIELGKPITVELRIDDKGPISLELTVAVEEADRAAKKDSDVNMFPDVDTIRQSGYGYFKPPPPTEQEKKDLAGRGMKQRKDFKMAEFYGRTNNPDNALLLPTNPLPLSGNGRCQACETTTSQRQAAGSRRPNLHHRQQEDTDKDILKGD